MKEIKIREANLEDHSIIVDFQVNMAQETEDVRLDRQILSAGVISVIKDPSKAKYFMADYDGETVGMLMITLEWSDWRNGWIWWIQSVYTKPEYRKMGVYKVLYYYIKEMVSNSENIKGIRLYVDKRNIKAQKVYQALGMTCEHYITYEWIK